VEDMYRRLAGAEHTLQMAGSSRHGALQAPPSAGARGPALTTRLVGGQVEALQRLAAAPDVSSLLVLAQAFTPLGLGGRNGPPKYNQLTPLTEFADGLLAESPAARKPAPPPCPPGLT
jgi:hypothetical protein